MRDMSPKVLDCTLRDGGYYVDWDFDEELVRKYLAAVVTAKIDIIEIGFRFISPDKFLGAFAFSTDEYLCSVNLPKHVSIAVMVNASELINHKDGVNNAINNLFLHNKNSPVDIVRVAVKANDIDACREIAEVLDVLGYRVFINLMQVDKLEENELLDIAKKIECWSTVEVFYFADSFGSMDAESVKSTISVIRQGWSGSIGIHTHDNKGLALSNSLVALKNGVQHLDATLSGMGRGAGNAKTEYMLVELVKLKYEPYFPDALFPLVIKEFNELQLQYNWGGNIYYYLSAIHNIHPTYIQEMLGDDRYDVDQILSAINFLKSSKVPFFSFENMLRAASGIEGDEYGTWSGKDWIKNRTVLILGSGPGTKKYIKSLQQYVNKHKPIVLCLNVNEFVPVEMVDAYVACHESRILIESDSYIGLKKPIILPRARIPEGVREALQEVEILDYGLRIEKGGFEIIDSGCVLDAPLALMYAISMVTASGADQILMAGFDGYDASDLRQREMVDVLQQYKTKPEGISLTAITPTTFPVHQSSIFAINRY